MADYTGVGRTNYFKVKDEEAFLKFLNDSGFSLEIIRRANDEGCIGLVDDGNGSGVWQVDGETNDQDEIEVTELPHEIAPFLEDGEVAVFLEIGKESMRYLIGEAIAVHSSGKQSLVTLADIYQRAFEELGVRPRDAAY